METTFVPQKTAAPAAKKTESEPRGAPAGARAGMPIYLQRAAECASCEEEQRFRIAVQPGLEISAPDDPPEREAEQVAQRVMRMPEAGKGSTGFTSYQRSAENPNRESSGLSTAGVSSSSGSGGAPLPRSEREFFEPRLGRDLSGVRVHTDSQAEKTARAVNARAFALGSDIFFNSGQYRPDTTLGHTLIAHELTHVIQNQTAPNTAQSVIQRDRIGPTPSTEQNVATADRIAQKAGPCGVIESSLSNEGLLFQLNRARVYLSQNKRGEGQWYDYANLLRRLSNERRRRIRGGHVWLAEPGLLHTPGELYALVPTDGLRITVVRVSAEIASGAYVPSPLTLMASVQFERFLEFYNIPTTSPQALLSEQDPTYLSTATIDLPTQQRSMYITPALNFYVPGQKSPFISDIINPSNDRNQINPFGFGLFNHPGARNSIYPSNIGMSSFTGLPIANNQLDYFPQRYTYTPTSRQLLQEMRNMPSRVSSSGPERVYISRSTSPSVSSVILLPGLQQQIAPGYPTGVSSLGYLGRPGIGLPNGTTGILWEGSHVVDFALLNDRMFTRGFRASGLEHSLDFLAPELSGARSRLNVGMPGAYRNDFLFPAAGEVWGRAPFSSKHWRFGSVAIVRADGSPATAQQLIELMVAVAPNMRGEYRYSPPPKGSIAYEAAEREALRRGLSGYNPTGGENCINVPADLHQTALGGVELKIIRQDGTIIDLSDPVNASARNMSEFMSQPDSFFEERGLRRINIGQRALTGMGVAGGLGVGMTLATDAWRYAQGGNISTGQVIIHAGIGGTTSAGGVLAEDFAYNALTTRLVSSGVSAGTSSTLGRLGASTGVGIIIAPAATGLEMAFSDQDYTRIDYTARMGRSAVSAGGGALTSGLFFAAMGSEVPIAGNIVGFLIGIGGYYLTDAILGDPTENLIREEMGEYGCSQGVGPGH